MVRVKVNFKSRSLGTFMKIGEAARFAGLAPAALRHFEKAGVLTPAARRNGIRVYSQDVVYELTIICFARELGFTLPEIRLLLHGFPKEAKASARWKKLADRK